MKNKLIIALDSLAPDEAKILIQHILRDSPEYSERIIFKIHDLQSLIGFQGLEELLLGIDCKLMLDPKWHDIPNTLKNYIIQLSKTGLADKVEYITLHASGGSEMLRVSQETKTEYIPHVKLLGITAMTSLDNDDTWYIYDNTAKHSVLRLTKLALDSGIEWIVCSTHESSALREVYGEGFDIITPGVRFAWWDAWDQKRVKTPIEAIQNGSTHIVMWRPILESKDSTHAIQRFFTEIWDVSYIAQHSYSFEKMLYTGGWKEVLSYIGAFYFKPEWWKYVRFTSKVVSNAYINIGAIERSYSVIDRATSELAIQIRAANIQADVIVWAQMWSVRISLALAKKLWVDQSVYTEKTGNNNSSMDLKRHAIDLTWKRIILSEDIVSRGTTIAKMREVMENLWWTVVAIACVGNRYEQDSQDGIPIISCFVPPKFELYWDENTPEDQRKDFPKLPVDAKIAEKPKNQWGELVESMRK
jgi:orotidine-5'-phosphate decarboxylase